MAQTSARRCGEVEGAAGSSGMATDGVAEGARFPDAVDCPDALRVAVEVEGAVRVGMIDYQYVNQRLRRS